MAVSLRKKKNDVDPLVKAQTLGSGVREFFSTLLGDLEEASSLASTAAAQSEARIAAEQARKDAALAEINANATLVKGLRNLAG
jgi:hypothetical protein